MMTDLPSTISDAAAALRSRRLSSVELTRELLAQAHAAQDTLGAFVTICDESALKAARAADDDLARGVDHGPLQGIPIAVKDILATLDAPTTASSRVLDPAWGKDRDATVVSRLREAGAVILGKAVLHEFAVGWPDPDTGLDFAHNPWNLANTPGGSSSGTAAAVAGGLVLGGIGTDTGGSIRGPAAYTGISGLKATFGRVSKEGCVPLGYSLDHIGPMARTAHDCAVMLNIMAGYDPLDPCTVQEPVPDYVAALNGSVEGVRIGVPRVFFFDVPELKHEVHDAVLRAVEVLRSAGAVVKDVTIPHATLARYVSREIMLGEAYAYHRSNLQTRPELYGKHTRHQLLEGALYSAADYVQAQRVRSVVKRSVLQAIQDVDVLVTPTMLGTAPAFEDYDPEAMRKTPSFMSIWNVTGQPATSVPCGLSDIGLPIGLQIVGKPFEEPMLLGVADAYQRLTSWHTLSPTGMVKEVQPA